jgi:hypothetical protein
LDEEALLFDRIVGRWVSMFCTWAAATETQLKVSEFKRHSMRESLEYVMTE